MDFNGYRSGFRSNQAHSQSAAGRFSVTAQGGKGWGYTTTLKTRDGGLGRTETPGKFRLRQLCRRPRADQRLDQPEFVVYPGIFLPEPGVFHKVLLEVSQSRHGITCFIRSLAIASARRGVLRDFFSNTCKITTRRPVAVT